MTDARTAETPSGSAAQAASIPAAVIIVAMDEEAAPFLARADEHGPSFASASGHGIRRDLIIDGTPVALLRGGIGFANATAAAAYAFYTFGADVPVISAGTAGGLARGVRVGDVIIGERYVNLNADATAFGYSLGQVPGMPEDYAADRALTQAAVAARAEATGAGAAATATAVEDTVRTGLIGSGEVFVTEKRALALRADFPYVIAVDMESAAIAQFAHTHGQAFVSIRAISDLCAPDGDEFLTHVDGAADRSAEVVAGLLTRLG